MLDSGTMALQFIWLNISRYALSYTLLFICSLNPLESKEVTLEGSHKNSFGWCVTMLLSTWSQMDALSTTLLYHSGTIHRSILPHFMTS